MLQMGEGIHTGNLPEVSQVVSSVDVYSNPGRLPLSLFSWPLPPPASHSPLADSGLLLTWHPVGVRRYHELSVSSEVTPLIGTILWQHEVVEPTQAAHCPCDVWGFLRWLGVWREHPKASSSPATLGVPCCLAGPDPLDQGPYRVIIKQTCRWRSWQTLHLFQELNLKQFIRDLQMIEKKLFL